MRAALCDRYGPPSVEHLVEVATPVPGDHDLLIRIHASTVNRTDCGLRRAHPFFFRAFTGLTRPRKKTLGSEFAGVVETVGPSVVAFAPGDAVFGVTRDGHGTHAEFVCVGDDAPIAAKPDSLTFEEAASVCMGAIQALTCMRSVMSRGNQRILIYGASGSIGTAAVQLAAYYGAHVTAVCNTKNVEVVRSLGADEVIDYTQDDFTRNGETYDVIFDAVGKHSYRRCRRSLVPRGEYVVTDLGFMWQNPYLGIVTAVLPTRRVRLPFERHADTKRDVALLKELIEAGRYRAVIDRAYPLEQVVEANEYVETEQKTGNVVLTVIPERAP